MGGWVKLWDADFEALTRELDRWPDTLVERHLDRLLDPNNPAEVPSAGRLAGMWGVSRATAWRRLQERVKRSRNSLRDTPTEEETEESEERETVGETIVKRPLLEEKKRSLLSCTNERSEPNGSNDDPQITMPGVEPPPIDEAAELEAHVETVLALWGEQVNPALGRRALGPGAYGAKTRRAVRKAVKQHGHLVVVDAVRVLVEHPSGEWFRRKATSPQGARWLTLGWYMGRDLGEAAAAFQAAPHAHANARRLHEVVHEDSDPDVEIPL